MEEEEEEEGGITTHSRHADTDHHLGVGHDRPTRERRLLTDEMTHHRGWGTHEGRTTVDRAARDNERRDGKWSGDLSYLHYKLYDLPVVGRLSPSDHQTICPYRRGTVDIMDY